VLALKTFAVDRRPLVRGRLSAAVVVLLATTLVEALNPETGAAAGALGLLFTAAPLLWFFIGRELAGQKLLNAVLTLTLVSSTIAAAYGLLQAYVGLPPWDTAWLQAVEGTGQYAALSVNGVIRAWGPFASAAEYATMLGAGIAAAIARTMHGRLLALIVVPLLGYAVFVESSRGILLLILLAVVAIAALRLKGKAIRIGLIGVTAAAALAGQQVLAANLDVTGLSSVNPLVAHQLGGLAYPFDPTQSTAGLHLNEIGHAFLSTLSHPLGLGTGATNLASVKAGVQSSASEVDISDEFTSLGVAGGLLYCGIVVAMFWRTGSAYNRRRTYPYAAALGLLIVSFGNWLNGGYYAISSIVWFVAGACEREALAIARERRVPSGADTERTDGITSIVAAGPARRGYVV
jgi:hypothetical protein